MTHDPEAIWSSQLAVAQRGRARGRRRSADRGNRDHQPARDDDRLGPRDRCADRRRDRLAVADHGAACERLRLAGHEALFRERTGLPLDAYFSGPKIAHDPRRRAGRSLPCRARRAGLRHRRLVPPLAADRRHRRGRGRPRDRRLERQPERCSSTSIASTGTTSCSPSSACRAACCRRSGRPPASSARPRRSSSAARSPSPRSPATSRRRRSARRASRPARRRTRTAPARSCC